MLVKVGGSSRVVSGYPHGVSWGSGDNLTRSYPMALHDACNHCDSISYYTCLGGSLQSWNFGIGLKVQNHTSPCRRSPVIQCQEAVVSKYDPTYPLDNPTRPCFCMAVMLRLVEVESLARAEMELTVVSCYTNNNMLYYTNMNDRNSLNALK